MTRRLVVLGAGTAGTMVVNKLRRRLPRDEWEITVVDRDDVHHYQPGYLFLPFGTYTPRAGGRSRRHGSSRTASTSCSARSTGSTPDAERGAPDRRAPAADYDYLVIATGIDAPAGPDARACSTAASGGAASSTSTPSTAPRRSPTALPTFDGGRLVVHVTDMPIKCPVAPLEFTFLADAWLRERGLRDRVELVYVTPLPGAFTKPVASAHLGGMLDERKIVVEPDFLVERVDDERKRWSPTTSGRSRSTCWSPSR